MSFPSTFSGPIGLMWARAERAGYFHGYRYAIRLAASKGQTATVADYAKLLGNARKMRRLPHVADLRQKVGAQ